MADHGTATAAALAPKPDHVPDALVFDWDFMSPAGFNGDIRTTWKQLQDGPDIIWTPRNGGHWIAIRAADIEFMQKNPDPFSMKAVALPASVRPRILPLELDPPEHGPFRNILNRFFTPSGIKWLQEEARNVAIDLIERVKHDGRCDFIEDFSMRLPIAIFMKAVNQPLDDLDSLLAWSEMAHRAKTPEERVEGHNLMRAYLRVVIQARRENPGTDLLSAVVGAEINGQPLPEENLLSMTTNIMFGGLDTVAATLGFSAQYLALHPDKRQQLIDRPELIANAADELLRMFAPSTTARTLTRDYTINGVDMREGDKVYVRPMLHGLDDRKFENAMEADWERPNLERNFASFGNGAHRCPGAALARSEIRIFLEEWLQRIPDFDLDPNYPPVVAFGMINAIESLPLVWDAASVR